MGVNPTFPLKLTVASTKVCWQQLPNLPLLCVDNGMSLHGHLRGTDVFSPQLASSVREEANTLYVPHKSCAYSGQRGTLHFS